MNVSIQPLVITISYNPTTTTYQVDCTRCGQVLNTHRATEADTASRDHAWDQHTEATQDFLNQIHGRIPTSWRR